MKKLHFQKINKIATNAGDFQADYPKTALCWVNVYLNVNTCLLGEILSFLNSSCFCIVSISSNEHAIRETALYILTSVSPLPQLRSPQKSFTEGESTGSASKIGS